MKIFKKSLLVIALILTFCSCPIILFSCQKSPKLELVQPFKTTYFVGEKLDIFGGIIKYTDENGEETNIAVSEDMVSIFSTEKPGNRKLIITYLNKTILVDYTVNPYDVQEDVIYWDSQKSGLHTFISFNKAENVITVFYSEHTSFPEGFPEDKTNMPFSKSFDEDGNIVYSVEYHATVGEDGIIKCKVTDITKDSFMLNTLEVAPITFTLYSFANS